MKAYRITHIIFTEADQSTEDILADAKLAQRFWLEECGLEGYVSSATPVSPASVKPAAPEPGEHRASRK